jgi:phage-related protein (TIGR01555 family)
MRIVHRSRILEVAGTFSTNRTLVKNNYQPDSVLDAAYEALQRFGITMQTASYIIQDFVTKVMKIKDFDQQFGDEETASDLQSRVEFMQTSNAAWSTVMIDSEEEFQKISTTIAGVPETVKLMIKEIAGASEIPESVLFGESLGQLSGATASINNFYDNVGKYQEQTIKPMLEKLVDYMFLDRSFRGEIPDYDITFNPLKELTKKEIYEAENTRADALVKYYNIGVLTEQEIADSVFQKDNELGVEIDATSRRELALPPVIGETENE